MEGNHLLSGFESYSYEDDFTGYTCEGVSLIIDGEVWQASYDPDDGYRSYANIYKTPVDPKKIKNRFPAQMVWVREIVNHVRDESEDYYCDYSGIEIYNTSNGRLILSVGTDTTDSYYPCGNFEYHPENLPCNTKINN